MRSVARILLGSAAGIAAVTGAQAADADLPVKAKPVEYVKVCSLYGAGFWYVPGTDTCIKIGAFVKLDVHYHADGSGSFAGGAGGTTTNFGGMNTRGENELTFRNREAISFDMRSATDYGTLRSYVNVGSQIQVGTGSVGGAGSFNPTGPAPSFGTSALFVDRAFLQFAGFTAGRMRSFFDMVNTSVYALAQTRANGDTSPNGIVGIAYTWQFGGGLSASVSFEDGGWGTGGRGRSTVNLSGGSVPPGPSDVTSAFGLGTMMPDNKGQQFFDPVLNVRLDQAWGFIGVSAALHDASGGYYGSGFSCATVNPAAGGPAGAVPGLCGGAGNGSPNSSPPTAGTPTPSLTTSGHPGDAFGWATSVGFTLANPLGLQGDSVGAQAVYSVGAVGYNTGNWGSTAYFGSGNKVSMTYMVDGVYNTGTNVELNKTWSFQAFYEHIWNSRWRTSIYGGMIGQQFDANAKAMICPGGPNGTPNPVGFTGGNQGVFLNTNSPAGVNNANGAVTNCNPDSSVAQMGTRTMWNPVPDLDVGFDVSWVHLNTAFAGTGNLNAMGSVFQPNATARPSGPYNISNQDVLSAYFRIQRNFLY
jgi:hypothetical protein